MSFIGNFASARAYKKIGQYNNQVYYQQAQLQRKKTEQAKAVYDKVDRKRLTKKQDAELDFLFVNLLKSGVEVREDTSPYFVMLESGINQATDLAIADFNSKQAYYDGINQSLLLESKGQGELFKGKVQAQTEVIKGLATMGGNYASSGSILTG